jgi:hypothetical protein
MTTSVSTASVDRHVVRSVPAEVLERLRVLVVAGVTVGVLVVGVGSRLAMMLLRLTSPDRVRGVTSDDGFEIGQVTLAGTYNLLLLGAAFGVIGAAAYRAVHPWLIGPHWFQRLTIGLAAAAVVGSMLIHADGIDFTLLQPTWLAISLFVALPAVFAVAIGAAVDRVAAPGSWTAKGRRRWILPILLIVPFPGVLIPVVLATIVLTIWVPIQRVLFAGDRPPVAVGLLVRGAWLSVAVLGLLALLSDIGDLV